MIIKWSYNDHANDCDYDNECVHDYHVIPDIRHIQRLFCHVEK